MRRAIIFLITLTILSTLSADLIKYQSFENTAFNDRYYHHEEIWCYTDEFDQDNDWYRAEVSSSDGNWSWVGLGQFSQEKYLNLNFIDVSSYQNRVITFDNKVFNMAYVDDWASVFVYWKRADGQLFWDTISLDPDTHDWETVTFYLPEEAEEVMLTLSASNPEPLLYVYYDNIRLTGDPIDPPNISNITATQRTDGSGLVDIGYDVFDGQDRDMKVTLELSDDGGASYGFMIDQEYATGDLGYRIFSGTNKSIVWDAQSQGFDLEGDNFRLRVLAQTEYFNRNLTYVPAGYFMMGREGVATPVHNVWIDHFWMSRHEVTWDDFLWVIRWAFAEGYAYITTTYSGDELTELAIYADDTEGYWFDTLIMDLLGDGAIKWTDEGLFCYHSMTSSDSKDPCAWISWYGAVFYCNFLSMIDGLTPCYDLENWTCDFSATGYRLPTEAEWEYCARNAGADPDYLYAGSNTVGDVAWYEDNSLLNGLLKMRPVGSKQPNSIGTYDQSGNAWEWVWDRWDENYYENSMVPNPTGPETGSHRVIRGGSFNSSQNECDVAYRSHYDPEEYTTGIGFRICKRIYVPGTPE